MYSIYDRKNAVLSLQKFLGKINKNYFITQSGVYDSKTRLAVEAFQKEHGLEVTGTVDFSTYNLIYSEYIKATGRESSDKHVGSLADFPVGLGYCGKGIEIICETVRYLLRYYGSDHEGLESNVYSSRIENGVKILLDIYGLEDNGYLTAEEFSVMLKDSDSIKKLVDFGDG